PPAGDHQRVVGLRADLVEGGVEGEVVAALLAVGLVALEVVDGGPHLLAGLLAGADRVDGVADHLKRLERHHRLVVLDEVADQHPAFLTGHPPQPFLPSMVRGKCSMVMRSPSARPTFGSQPKSRRARVMSGWRTFGSSCGSGL